ncbi:hypothetical protein [Nitrosococcus watsonii]|uniref:hypothetical protein n=1 Tax=Nitrosococcus watsonii TaxID=473531 RepID=UPI001E5E4A1E|nr:hypothetical protein [Nitrosococcus watsonii]
MKNITLSADEHLIEVARQRAAAEHTTLNEQYTHANNSSYVFMTTPLRNCKANLRLGVN